MILNKSMIEVEVDNVIGMLIVFINGEWVSLLIYEVFKVEIDVVFGE